MRTYVHTERPSQTQSRPLSACLLAAALAPVVIAGLIHLAPMGWSTLQQSAGTQPTPAQCMLISDAGQRLACYDRAETPPEPAKGATAPLATR
jgi:hypothetical protein